MAFKIDTLNRELRCRIKAGKPNLWSHGNGLCFALAKNGKATWVYRYSINGKRRVMTLEQYADVISEKRLKELEILAIEFGDQVRSGIDPLDRKARESINTNPGDTFRDVAEAYIETQKAGWRNGKHADQWEKTLEAFAYSTIGSMRPHEIGVEDILRVLQQPHRRRNGVKVAPLWEAVPETASRVRMRLETVIAAAKSKATGSADRETRALWQNHVNPARWEDGLEHRLTKGGRAAKQHHAAMPYGDLPAFFCELSKDRDFSAKALVLTILCATRTSETLNATWNEFDLDAATWTIPAERMKAGNLHRIPLPTTAIELLRNQPRFQGNPFAFAGAKRGRPLSNMSMLEKLRGLRPGLTVHGFRSAFRDWITDTTIHPDTIAETALAHTVANKVEAAYRRGEAFERRAVLMQQWCDYLTMKDNDYKRKWERHLAIAVVE